MGLKLVDFGKEYSGRELFEKVNLELPDRGCFFLMGENGAGKTTLIKCVCGLERFEGDISGMGAVLTLWDDPPFYENISGLRNLIILSEGRQSRRQILNTATEMLPVEILKRAVRTYSYGQRKKLAQVLAQILPWDTLILDEISNGLDYPSVLELKDRIRGWGGERCVLMTGHQYGFYNDMAQCILVIKNGAIFWAQEPEIAENRLEGIYERELLGGKI